MPPCTIMKYILGKKENMSQLFDDDKGKVVAVTIVSAGPVYVTQIKTKEKDGYGALQFGYGLKKILKIKKPQRMKTEGISEGLSGFSYHKETRTDKNVSDLDLKQGDKIIASVFEEGDKVRVSGVTKGKGFQGVVKRHGFHGGPRSHGQKHSEREPGSIGSSGIQRVIKGMRMGGRMGSDRQTTQNLKIIKVDEEKNLLYISGAVPGRRGTLIEIKG